MHYNAIFYTGNRVMGPNNGGSGGRAAVSGNISEMCFLWTLIQPRPAVFTRPGKGAGTWQACKARRN